MLKKSFEEKGILAGNYIMVSEVMDPNLTQPLYRIIEGAHRAQALLDLHRANPTDPRFGYIDVELYHEFTRIEEIMIAEGTNITITIL